MEYKERETIDGVDKKRCCEDEDTEYPTTCSGDEIKVIFIKLFNEPHNVLKHMKSVFGETAPLLNQEFFDALATLDLSNIHYIYLWEYILTGNSENEAFIKHLDILEQFIANLPNTMFILVLLLEHVQDQVVKFNEDRRLLEILPLINQCDPLLVARLLNAISSKPFELPCETNDYHDLICYLLDTCHPDIVIYTLKSIEKIAKVSFTRGVKFSTILIERFGSFIENPDILEHAFSALSVSLVLDTDTIPNFDDFWPLVIETLHSDNEKLVLKACDFFESAIIEFTSNCTPSEELISSFFELINEGSFKIREHAIMVIALFVKTTETKEQMELLINHGACSALLDFLEYMKGEELTQILEALNHIVLEVDPLPDELVTEFDEKIQENELETENEFDKDIIRSILSVLKQYF